MSSFKIKIEGLEILKQQLKADSSISRLVPDMTQAVSNFHNTLERRVADIYTLKQPLSSVMIGRSVEPEQLGNTFLRFSLQYQYKHVDLSAYNTIVDKSEALSFAPPILGQTHHWREGQFSKRVRVQIQKGKTLATREGRNYRKKGFMLEEQIAVRKGSKTWQRYPTFSAKGIRAPIRTLYGPSLSRLAQITIEKDKQMATAAIQLEDNIIKAFTKFYD
jgi:hypothetical protein